MPSTRHATALRGALLAALLPAVCGFGAGKACARGWSCSARRSASAYLTTVVGGSAGGLRLPVRGSVRSGVSVGAPTLRAQFGARGGDTNAQLKQQLLDMCAAARQVLAPRPRMRALPTRRRLACCPNDTRTCLTAARMQGIDGTGPVAQVEFDAVVRIVCVCDRTALRARGRTRERGARWASYVPPIALCVHRADLSCCAHAWLRVCACTCMCM